MDEQARKVLEARLNEFIADAKKIQQNIEEAMELVAQDKPQSACSVVSLCAYPLHHLQNDWDGVMEEFENRGISPGKFDD